ncbi:MAG: 5-methyltetrahydropteroyltriglutamate--homocysteine S-methyltransferase [Rhodospirillales bacterium]|nr:5-methyltetrahydropteroyltriglutamate--homocysteine S-methyltransferase [Rhodospirillales bacterium]
MSIAANLGFPRIGARRALKFLLEGFWAGEIDPATLQDGAAALRAAHWRLQAGLGIGHVPSNEDSLYDHVLDMACMLGAIPAGYGWQGGPVSLASYFALARGAAGVKPLAMTKWFDTNYHYLVPLLAADQRFTLTENRPLARFQEARALALRTRPVLLGPVSFLMLSRRADGGDPLALLDALLPLYTRILGELADAGCVFVQMDEPVLARDLSDAARAALRRAYDALAGAGGPGLILTSYFGPLGDHLDLAVSLPSAGLHVDLTRGGEAMALAAALPAGRLLSLGVIDGRNVWRADLRARLGDLRAIAARREDGAAGLIVAPSCSLLHVPLDANEERALDPALRGALAFAVQKLAEISALARGLEQGEAAIADALAASDAAHRARAAAPGVHRADIAARLAAVDEAMTRRASPYPARRAAQAARLGLPLFPTTTIGSFPQTTEIRRLRAAHGRGEIDAAAYDRAMAGWIDDAIAWQEELGIDVLVHGEFERNDMVQYFADALDGFAITRHGWVQSYGSRCVAPPIIWGDVARPAAMTLRWTRHAQSRTARPVKGMLTGPVTMLNWSFVRSDIPRETVCRQIALALREEVRDLALSGIAVIQVDEPALREGLPLRRAGWAAYLDWAVRCFRLATAGVGDDTAIHTHMCYSEFADIMDAIAALDADAISIETARGRMALLDAFRGADAYPAEIGPGVWDIHSPRVPDAAEMAALLRRARSRLADWQIWVNPDCGLKTRNWAEVRPALAAMVEAARTLRAEVAAAE